MNVQDIFDASVVTETGVVHRPAAGADAVTETLTATITKGEATASKSFDITVLPLKPAGRVDREQLLFGVAMAEAGAINDVYHGLLRRKGQQQLGQSCSVRSGRRPKAPSN